MAVALSGPPDMTGRVVFVTGAAGGIGRMTTERLAEAGATVVATDLVGPTPGFAGKNISFRRCDVTDRAATEAAVAETIRDMGRIDVMILGAGLVSNTPLSTVGDDEWEKVQAVNVLGVINPARGVWNHMIERKSGKFVLIGSIAVRIGGFAAGPAYTAAKGAVHGIGKWMAKHGAPHGVVTNVVAPGPVVTPMFETVTEQRAPAATETIPLKRYGQPEDIAQAILFLASPQSNWMTGTVINVNGGYVFD